MDSREGESESIMGYQSPAKVLRSLKRMTKYIESKVYALKPALTSTVLPVVSISPVLTALSIVHVQSTSVPSTTHHVPSPASRMNHTTIYQMLTQLKICKSQQLTQTF